MLKRLLWMYMEEFEKYKPYYRMVAEYRNTIVLL